MDLRGLPVTHKGTSLSQTQSHTGVNKRYVLPILPPGNDNESKEGLGSLLLLCLCKGGSLGSTSVLVAISAIFFFPDHVDFRFKLAIISCKTENDDANERSVASLWPTWSALYCIYVHKGSIAPT